MNLPPRARHALQTNGLSCNRSSPIGRDRALHCGCTAHWLVQQPRPLWPRQTSPYAFSITSFKLTEFAIVVITNASDTECIFWTRPAGTCLSAPTICSLKPRPHRPRHLALGLLGVIIPPLVLAARP